MQRLDLDVRADGSNRVRTRIGDTSYVLEASIPLAPRVESGLSAAFFPAMVNSFAVESAVPADRHFTENIARIVPIASQWWGWEARNPFIVQTTSESAAPLPLGALFFTGGVDSFCSLLRHPAEIAGLIHVHGFDIRLHDAERYRKARDWIAAVANATGIEPIYVSTDLRQNTLFASVSWEITHVAALACLGHLLAERFGRIFLASSDVPPPWGSNEVLDPLWSSSRIKIINDGWILSRLEKVKFISGSRLVHRHLKVCWENRSSELNCGYCEKCVRTQAQFAIARTLDSLEVFPNGSLCSKIDDVANVHGELKKQWIDIRRETTDLAVLQAIDRLLGRSEGNCSPPVAMSRFGG